MYTSPSDYRKPIILKPNKTILYLYFLDKEHPLASKPTGIVYYHRHIVSVNIGRWLLSSEHVHHKDGNRLNNKPENLEILARSKHTQKHHPQKPKHQCLACSNIINYRQKYCSIKCSNKSRLKFDVDFDTLNNLFWQYPTTKVAKMFGVSDKAIQKRCKKLGVKKPPRGYWTKVHCL